MRQIECQRLFQDHDVDALPELRTQQRLAQRQATLHAGERRDQQSFEQHQAQHTLQIVTCSVHRRYYRIDDLRAHPGNQRRQQSTGEGQQGCRDQQWPVGIPDQAYRVTAVAKYAEETAQRPAPAASRRRRRR